jgi:hypothetical protein
MIGAIPMFVRIVDKNLTMNHHIKDTEKTNTQSNEL